MDIVDRDTLEELRDVMEDEFSLLIDTFIQDAPGRIAELRSVHASDDIAGLEKPAHTLKGSSSNIGAPKLSSICAALVDGVRAGDPGDVDAAIADIEQAFLELKDVLLTFKD